MPFSAHQIRRYTMLLCFITGDSNLDQLSKVGWYLPSFSTVATMINLIKCGFDIFRDDNTFFSLLY